MASPKVDNHHEQYDEHKPLWKTYREFAGGARFVKASKKIKDYVPALEGQKDEEYKKMIQRGMFYSATARTVKGLRGMIFRRPITLTPEDHPWFRRASADGQGIEILLKEAVWEVLVVARMGLLVDMPADGQGEPYIASYKAEAIENWRYEMIDGEQQLTLVVLEEETEMPDPDDPFQTVEEEQYRVLKLEYDERGPFYVQEVWVESKESKSSAAKNKQPEFERILRVVPTVGGDRMNFIPFEFLGPFSNSPEVDESPIADLVEVNMSHFQSSVDLEHGRHFTGLPTVMASGFSEDTQFKVGSTVAWVSEDPQADAKYIEFTGKGLGSLEKALADKEVLMTLLGARLLEAGSPTNVESSGSLLLRRAGENGILVDIANSVSASFNRCLEWVSRFSKNKDTLTVSLNTDFDPRGLTPQMITAMVAAWQAGGLTDRQLAYNFREGELLEPGMTLDEAEKGIKKAVKAIEKKAVAAEQAKVPKNPADPNTPQIKATADVPTNPDARG